MDELKRSQLIVLEDERARRGLGGIDPCQGQEIGAGHARGWPAPVPARGEEDHGCRAEERARSLPPVILLTLACVATVSGQQWNSPEALTLADRAIARRAGAAADTTLHDYRAQGHGFVFFLGAFGEGLVEPPRLIKADQLELELYWMAPGASKQRIIGWRDRAELPTDIVYHQDHLGIVQNGFGRMIRLGDGDEVQGVPHPLAAGGPLLYDYATGDTLTVQLAEREIRVVELLVRPKDVRVPRIVGTAFLDVGTAELVRLAFNFTAAAYRDATLEDVSIVLDNALYEGRWWLPRHQEIEIRRRATFLDIPARGIIRGRWEIDGYVFNTGLTGSWFAGPEIVPAPKAVRDSFPWRGSLDSAALRLAGPVRRDDLAQVRAEVARIAGRRALSAWRHSGLSIRNASELLSANRVQGVVPGAGVVWRRSGFEARVRASYGFADRHADGALSGRLAITPAGVILGASLYRDVRDIGDEPVIAPLLNSIAAQEFGIDYGDYLRAIGARLTLEYPLGGGLMGRLGVAREGVRSLAVRASPANGTFRPNPALGGPALSLATIELRRPSEGMGVSRDASFDVSLEGGRSDGGATYVRLAAGAHVLLPVGATRVLTRVSAGLASRDLPAHRTFVLGGRGTLLGDDFRVWGGRVSALAHLEWRVPVPFPSLSFGAARTPGRITLAPFVAGGWTDRPVTGTPWLATPAVRVTTGVGVEWLGVFRIEAGYGVQSRRVHASFDVTRDLWSVL